MTVINAQFLLVAACLGSLVASGMIITSRLTSILLRLERIALLLEQLRDRR